jgi:transcription termination factor NusB
VINEAVELAKRYGAAESFRFVNAVLDKCAREMGERASTVGKAQS